MTTRTRFKGPGPTLTRPDQFDLSDPPTDIISAVKFAPDSSQLLVSSWDRHVYLYGIHDDPPSGQLVRKFEHRAPVLDVCFGADDGDAFSAGLDGEVRRYSGLHSWEDAPLTATG
jgi:cell cycle arrest protein BUB3